MRRTIVATVLFCSLATSCQRHAEPRSATIAPAAARPGSLPPEMATLGRTSTVTTTGSPRPWKNRHATVENIEIDDQKITTRPRIGRMNTEFRITNRGTIPHALVFRGAHDPVAVPPLAPNETVYLSLTITDPHYALSCGLPGHHEQGQFDTYQPR